MSNKVDKVVIHIIWLCSAAIFGLKIFFSSKKQKN